MQHKTNIKEITMFNQILEQNKKAADFWTNQINNPQQFFAGIQAKNEEVLRDLQSLVASSPEQTLAYFKQQQEKTAQLQKQITDIFSNNVNASSFAQAANTILNFQSENAQESLSKLQDTSAKLVQLVDKYSAV